MSVRPFYQATSDRGPSTNTPPRGRSSPPQQIPLRASIAASPDSLGRAPWRLHTTRSTVSSKRTRTWWPSILTGRCRHGRHRCTSSRLSQMRSGTSLSFSILFAPFFLFAASSVAKNFLLRTTPSPHDCHMASPDLRPLSWPARRPYYSVDTSGLRPSHARTAGSLHPPPSTSLFHPSYASVQPHNPNGWNQRDSGQAAHLLNLREHDSTRVLDEAEGGSVAWFGIDDNRGRDQRTFDGGFNGLGAWRPSSSKRLNSRSRTLDR